MEGESTASVNRSRLFHHVVSIAYVDRIPDSAGVREIGSTQQSVVSVPFPAPIQGRSEVTRFTELGEVVGVILKTPADLVTISGSETTRRKHHYQQHVGWEVARPRVHDFVLHGKTTAGEHLKT